MNDQAADAPTELAAAAERLGVAIPSEALAALDAYRHALWAWNEKLNLTRHTTFEKFVARDLVDTQQLAAQIPDGESVLDIGSGGGVPGLPLAILRPDLSVSACESVGKKARVLEAIVEELGLDVPVHGQRVEQVLGPDGDDRRFDTLVARGVAPLWKFMRWLRPCHQRWGRLLLIKGPAWVDERGEARHRGLMHGYELRRIGEYVAPEGEATTTLLLVSRKGR